MPDFRTKVDFPTEQYISAVAGQPNKYQKIQQLLDSGIQSFVKGLAINSEIQNIKEKKARRFAMAELINRIQSDPDIQEDLPILTNIAKFDPDKAIDLYGDLKLAKLKPRTMATGVTFVTPEQAQIAANEGKVFPKGTKIAPLTQEQKTAQKLKEQELGIGVTETESTVIADAQDIKTTINEFKQVLENDKSLQTTGTQFLSKLPYFLTSTKIDKYKGFINRLKRYKFSFAGKALTTGEQKVVNPLFPDVPGKPQEQVIADLDALQNFFNNKAKLLIQGTKGLGQNSLRLGGDIQTKANIPEIGGTFQGEKVLKVRKIK